MPIIDPGPRTWEPEPDGPCGLWPIDTDCCPGWSANSCDWEPRRLLAVEIATDLLWRLTAGRFGLCAGLIRPCGPACVEEGSGGLLAPVLDEGRWYNVPCARGCRSECSCGPLESLKLPGPVTEVIEVRLDGEVMSVGSWRLLRRGRRAELVRTDGGLWPRCQELSRSDNEPGTWSVLYARGRAVPAAGVRAVSTLACEIYKQCEGKACRLPDRVKQVTREGVSFEMYDPGEELEKGLTGLREVDMWIRAVNPHRATEPSAVFTLDLPGMPEYRRGAWDQR